MPASKRLTIKVSGGGRVWEATCRPIAGVKLTGKGNSIDAALSELVRRYEEWRAR